MKLFHCIDPQFLLILKNIPTTKVDKRYFEKCIKKS